MKRNTKGFYTLESAIFLPFVILAVLSLGYFMKVEGTWENCVHGALDESVKTASRAYGGVNKPAIARMKIKNRLMEDNPNLDYVRISGQVNESSLTSGGAVVSYNVEAGMSLNLPLGFQREFKLDSRIKYRGFVGRKISNVSSLGSEGLEREQEEKPVWIFPQSGEKYHAKTCTYVKASVEKKILSSSLKSKYGACGLCNSRDIPVGSVVFCFRGEDTAYHRGTCKSVKRHTIIIDESEAETKGYRPCSKCGGG